jgi:hypothetical protein
MMDTYASERRREKGRERREEKRRERERRDIDI